MDSFGREEEIAALRRIRDDKIKGLKVQAFNPLIFLRS